ncbi:MAG TPA: DUF2007 domain-containing protein [Candidatus Kapabacteria bacterium]|nr:DUF2007 domain-containing protein [Candidatus Kapabacteria bacterium]
MTNLKLLSTYQTEFEAELVRGKLEREGIEAMIESQDRSNMIPSLDYAGGVHLYVEPEDLERAKEIINSPDDDLMDDMEEA